MSSVQEVTPDPNAVSGEVEGTNEKVEGTKVEVKAKKKRPGTFRKFAKKHPLFTTIVCCLLAIVAVYFWKDIEGKREKNDVIEVATAKLDSANETMLKLLSKPLTWNIRSEMLRGNIDQVDLFLSDFVKENNFQFFMLVDPSGNVVLSTDKKLEGVPLEDSKLIELVNTDTTKVLKVEDGTLIVAAPVMGYDSRLSTLIFGYKPEPELFLDNDKQF